MSVSEEAPVGTTVGKVFAEDRDIGDNAAMDYFIDTDSSDIFNIITNDETQEGIILLKKVSSQKLLKKSLIIERKSSSPQASWMCKKSLLLWILSFLFRLCDLIGILLGIKKKNAFLSVDIFDSFLLLLNIVATVRIP